MQLVVPSAVSAADAAAIAILRRTSQILFFFIALCVFKVLINKDNCVCIMVLDYLSITIATVVQGERRLSLPYLCRKNIIEG